LIALAAKRQNDQPHEMPQKSNLDGCTSLAYNANMVIVETPIFTRLINELMGDDEYRDFQEVLVTRPDMGDLIQGGGGLRKVRWKLEGRGKSGGVRVIYYWVTADDQIRMLYVYPKGKQENLTQEQLAQLRKIVERWSDG
jgi:mRNA-degrading endonuclease RelE of RelBE toxin-antitoxin system